VSSFLTAHKHNLGHLVPVIHSYIWRCQPGFTVRSADIS